MKRRVFIWVIIGLVSFASCSDREPDMTLVQETRYRDYLINQIQVEDVWDLTVVQDDGPSYVDLEYSAYLHDYLHILYNENGLFHAFLGAHPHLPYNTVLKATIHTRDLQSLVLDKAATALVDGDFQGDSLRVLLKGASICKGGSYTGVTDIVLDGASLMADFSSNGTYCSVSAQNGSVFKGTIAASEGLEVKLLEDGHLITYGGSANKVQAEVETNSSLNMLKTEVEQMEIDMMSRAEAFVNVHQALRCRLADSAMLYYQPYPGLVLDADCDSTSHVLPLNPQLNL